MLSDRSADAPANSLKYARDLFRSRVAEPKASVVTRVLAALQMDLAPNRAAFGERSASGAGARQMLFDAGDNAVDLRIAPGKKGFDIRGQILGDGFKSGEVEISNDEITFKTKIADASGFNLKGVSAGQYGLTVRGNGLEIFIEKLILE